MAYRPKELARRVLGAFGLEVRRKTAALRCSESRQTLDGVLRHAASLGLTPATVVDVGAAEGTFTLACRKVFPRASYVLVEPLAEFAEDLGRLERSLPGVEVHRVAAASRSGAIAFNVHPDLYGSSLLLEREGGAVNGVPRTVPAATLDELVAAEGTSGAVLLKLDVQGAELDVLAGAPRTLAASAFVILEVLLYRAFENGPQLADVVGYMNDRGFAAFDIFGPLYRPLDGSLAAVDIAFVPEDSAFRSSCAFATAEQRAEMNRRFAAAHRDREKSRRGSQ